MIHESYGIERANIAALTAKIAICTKRPAILSRATTEIGSGTAAGAIGILENGIE